MYENIMPETIEAEILRKITAFDTGEGSFARTLVAPAAYELWKYYTALEGIPDMIFINENSGSYIDKKAADFGIARKPGAKATAPITFLGRTGVIVPAGKAFLTEDGLSYTLDEQVVIPVSGSASGTITAIEVGSVYNVGEGQIKLQQSPLSGLTSFSAGEASGGVDPETDAQLVERYYDHIRKPATSGNAYQYEQWAKSVTGVGEARVFPLWNGPGTVKVVVTDENYGIAPESTVEACAAYIEDVRPIGAAVTVESAEAFALTVDATVKLDTAITAEAVKSLFEESASDYLRSIAFQTSEIVYNRILFLLLNIEGVQDVTVLTVNGSEENISLSDTQIPALKAVTINV